jgi:hypothetical protein
MRVEIGVEVEVEIEQNASWFALELTLFAYSIPRLVYLILRLVNFERLRYLSIMA